MKHVENLNKLSENLDVIVKGTVTGKHVNSEDEVLYQIETPCGDCFEADEKCVFEDITKPVEVPQFVADWYEKHKNNFNFRVWDYVYMFDSKDESDFTRWLNDSSVDSFQTLVNMHQFGYKVEKVDLFRVKLANGGQYLYTERSGNTYFTCVSKSEYSKEKLKELGFEWVLDCKGIILEEV